MWLRTLFANIARTHLRWDEEEEEQYSISDKTIYFSGNANKLFGGKLESIFLLLPCKVARSAVLLFPRGYKVLYLPYRKFESPCNKVFYMKIYPFLISIYEYGSLST